MIMSVRSAAGRVTLREFARSLDLEVWAAHDLLRAEGVAVAQGEQSETRSALSATLEDYSSLR